MEGPAPSGSVRFFDAQFQRQLRSGDFALNPFERAALPYLRGQLLDAGCGLGNLAVAAAAGGCSVLALDGSPAAIAHLNTLAAECGLPIRAEEADLREVEPPPAAFDAVAAIGLVMFFDCPTARRQLARLQAAVRPGGVAAINVLVEGTTFLDFFGSDPYCLFGRDELARAFEGWQVLEQRTDDFDAPDGRLKRFSTVIARRPPAGHR
ncbi:MAG: class I SAM-dependent methyltransferase [Rubrivivax sp.]|nr:class I SAM-dependent methyltransferase [Rubrivivax sp.]